MATRKKKEEKRLTKEQAKLRLECSTRTINRLIEDQHLTVSTDEEGFDWFDPEEVSEAGELAGQNKKDAFVDQQTRALKDSHDHIRQLVNAIIEPLQGSHEALLKENSSLRKRCADIEQESMDVHRAYGEIMRSTIEMEMTVAHEQAAARQRDEAISILKDQVIPTITASFGARKFIENLSVIKIEALMETEGILDAEQIKTLRNELAKRERIEAKAKEKEKANANKENGNGKRNKQAKENESG